MGRRQDINTGASAACLVLAVIVGLATQSFLAGLVTFFVFGGILSLLKIIR